MPLFKYQVKQVSLFILLGISGSLCQKLIENPTQASSLDTWNLLAHITGNYRSRTGFWGWLIYPLKAVINDPIYFSFPLLATWVTFILLVTERVPDANSAASPASHSALKFTLGQSRSYLHFSPQRKYTTPQTEANVKESTMQESEITEKNKWTFIDHVLCAS